GSHSPDTMKMFAHMLYNYLKTVTVARKNDEDYELEEAHLKARNLELVQDAFEKSALRHLGTPPPSYEGPPLPISLPPPPSFDDYDIGAPAIPPSDSDRPLPPPVPKFRPIRYQPGIPVPIPPTSSPPSRVLLFKPSSMRQRPDEFIVRPPPLTRFNSPEGKIRPKSEAAPILSINQMPYRRPFFIPLPPYLPPSSALDTTTVRPAIYPLQAYGYRTDARVEAKPNRNDRKSSGDYILPHPVKKKEKKPAFHRKFMRRIYSKPLSSADQVNVQEGISHSSQSIRRRYRRKNK
ncbi:hypothetical protein PMAYCL1PPCAC_29214, partial [Pristionchus mayeri]